MSEGECDSDWETPEEEIRRVTRKNAALRAEERFLTTQLAAAQRGIDRWRETCQIQDTEIQRSAKMMDALASTLEETQDKLERAEAEIADLSTYNMKLNAKLARAERICKARD